VSVMLTVIALLTIMTLVLVVIFLLVSGVPESGESAGPFDGGEIER
jgi:hypothetical protein